MKRLIAVVGLPGSGKSEAVAQFLKEGYEKVYFGAVTAEELQRQGLEVNEKNERAVRENLRQVHGMAAYAILSLPKIEKLITKVNVVIDGLYSWEEYLLVKNKFPQLELLAIWASPKDRYQRLSVRKIRPLTEEEASSRDRSQLEKLNQGGPIAIADYTICNDSSMDDLIIKVKEVISND